VTNINFAVVSDNGATIGSGNYQQGDANMGDIRIAGYNFGAGNTAIAMANQPPPVNNYSLAGDITFNRGVGFNIGSTYDLFTVAAHEFGHALGLGESSVAQAVMFATYNGTRSGLYSDGVSGIQSIYSSNAARSQDTYDAAASNNTFATASVLTSQIDPVALTALLNNLDLTSVNGSNGLRTTTDVDYYTFTAPTATTSSLTVTVQSTSLSLLAPVVTVYAADQKTVLGSACGAGHYGTTLNVTVSNVTAGQQFYLKVAEADTTALGSGEYALGLNFGAGSLPAVTIPNTQTLNGSPLTAGGGMPQESEDPDDGPGFGVEIGGRVGPGFSTQADGAARGNGAGAAAIQTSFAAQAMQAFLAANTASMAVTGLASTGNEPALDAFSGNTLVPAVLLPSAARAGAFVDRMLARESQVGPAELQQTALPETPRVETSPSSVPESAGTMAGVFPVETIPWNQACAACFADSGSDSAAGAGPDLAILGGNIGGTVDNLQASTALMALFMGAYWSAYRPEQAERKQQVLDKRRGW
jgi:hypothetical protein